MGRKQWMLMVIGLCGLVPSAVICAPLADKHLAIMLIPLSFFLLTIGSTLGWMLYSTARDAWNRRHGVRVVGRVIHARQSGYSNYVPTWEVEAMLPDSTTTHLIVTRRFPFSPDEPIELVVNPRDPTHATLPAQPSYDF